MHLSRRSKRALFFILPLLYCLNAFAQANLPIYNGYCVNGFQNYSWATVNFATTFGGSNCVSVVSTTNYQAVYFGHADFPTAPYGYLDFWLNGGPSGGQPVQVGGPLDGSGAPVEDYLGTLQANTWQHFTVPLSTLGIPNATNCTGFWIQVATGTTQPVFYVSGVQLLASPAPATVHLSVNAANVIRKADTRWFGFNTAVWDSSFDTPTTSNLLKQCGCTTLRFPGGSLSDTYNWATDKTTNDPNAWATPFSEFIQIATNLGAQVFITANYGTGTSNEAAAWVASANITNHCNFKYWEIGNECYGLWEADSNSAPHDPYTYATRAAGYIQLMKAQDPTIKIGAVAVAGEDSDTNAALHSATNPVTGVVHYGWTPVMLSRFKSLGIYPDFLIYHAYPEYTSSGSNSADCDPLLLQVADNYCPSAEANWASAAQSMRMQLTDYLGGPTGSNIELCVTENNSDSGPEGRQMTSIVNGLYLADSVSQLMRTEFNSFLWWDLRNGANTTNGDFDPTLYGWRPFGDEGITWGTTNYPVFYAEKLLQYFVRAGDSVLNPSSDYSLLSDYAAQRTNGALTMLVINKDVTTNFNAQIVLTNYLPAATATIQSYGIAQDEATRTNAPAAFQDITETSFSNATTNFNYSFPAGTLTLFTFAPAPVKLHSTFISPSKFVLQYQGQANVPYVLQDSSNLVNWISVSTNTSSGLVSVVTNTPSSAQQFWRVIWVP